MLKSVRIRTLTSRSSDSIAVDLGTGVDPFRPVTSERIDLNTRLLFLCVIAISGCGITGNLFSNYGETYEIGTVLECGCFTVTSFDEYVRSSPMAYGENSYVAYQDYGPGMPRGVLYLVVPLPDSKYESVGSILRDADRKGRAFWETAKKLDGDLSMGSVWEAYVPADVRETSPRSRIIDREALIVRGSEVRRCGQLFLVAAMLNPLTLVEATAREWELLREEYAKFVSKTEWETPL